ncbi:MAG: HD domain-containing protein [Candidatus Bathyarchaeia archaeon]
MEAGKLRISQYVKNPNLMKHMIAVSAIMRSLARHLNEDEDLWEAVGLLHDIDYEKVNDDWGKHGLVSAEIVQDLLPESALHAIKAHNPRTGVEIESRLDIALISADALSGLIIATALMMPNKKISEVREKSLENKFRDRSFARGVDRGNIMLCERLGISLNDFFSLGLEALKSIGEELGL